MGDERPSRCGCRISQDLGGSDRRSAGQCLAWPGVVGAAPGDWATETIELRRPEETPSASCRMLHGLIESQDEIWVNWIEIRQPPGDRQA